MRVTAAAFTLATVLSFSSPAFAIRFGLGVATDVVPVVIDPHQTESPGSFQLGFRPVLEVEPSYWLSLGAYAPFTVFRTQQGTGAASSGAESVFGLTASGRYPFFRDGAPEEWLAYLTARGGFGTVNGRAGPFWGAGIGLSATWLGTGRGLFAELNLSRLHVGQISEAESGREVDRTTIGLSLGLVFHLGGEEWRP